MKKSTRTDRRPNSASMNWLLRRMVLKLTVTLLANAVALLLLAAPLAQAQQARIPRVGVLGGQSPEGSPPILALRQGLSELGYVDGQNIAIEWRWAQGKNEELAGLAAELVQLKVDNHPFVEHVERRYTKYLA